jgi:YD repeat-containing protein
VRDGRNRIQRIVLPDGKELSYDYSAEGDHRARFLNLSRSRYPRSAPAISGSVYGGVVNLTATVGAVDVSNQEVSDFISGVTCPRPPYQ